MKTKKSLFFIPFAFIIWLCGVIAASIYDLDISIAVMNQNSVYGRILEILGESPAILFTSFNFTLMSAYFRQKHSKNKAIATFIFATGTSVFTFYKITNYFEISVPLAICTILLLSAIFCFISYFIVNRLGAETVERFYSTATRCVLAAVLVFVLIWGLKLIFGRIRPRQLNGDYTIFTPWYYINGLTGYFSFPSGHTANAAVIFTGTFYFKFLPEKVSFLKPLIYIALIIWLIAVGLSRIIAGAHFLSDVLFGGGITLALAYFVKPKEK